MADSETLTLFERVMPRILQMPQAQQQAIGEAMTLLLEAREKELQASTALVQALTHTYTWWLVEVSDFPARRSAYVALRTWRIIGCGNLDAAQRARRVSGARYVHTVTPEETP
jgi:hypothetical protein